MALRPSFLLPALLSLVLALPAAGAASLVAVPPPPAAEVMGMLRQLETARVRGKTRLLEDDLAEQARARPNDAMPRFYLAWLQFPADACWNELKAVSTLFPENPWPHVGMGLVYIRWKLLAEARPMFAAALRESPGFAPALWGEGLLLQAQGRPAEAEARLREALDALDAPQIRTSLGLLLAQQPEREAEARALLARSVEDWPEQPEALKKLAQLSKTANDVRSAAVAGDRLVALKPRDREAHRLQADLWLAASEKDKAAQSLEKYVSLGGAEPASLGLLARLYAELGRPAEETKALQRLMEADAKDPEPAIRLAELAEAGGDGAAAEAMFLKASERAPQRADIHVRRARLFLKRELFQESLAAYRSALAAPERKVPEAEDEAAALVRRFRLPATPAQGAPDKIYARVSLGLVALYMERLKEQPDLKGNLKVRVQVDEEGRATRVETLYDSLKDPLIAGHAYFAFLDARYPPGRDAPVFQYVFRPPK
ncbi:tetratricopeptide repeat protein [Pyxidicoccus fallax]|uniref:Tetratricopeptide repeat protein n=1 Tax=Pyxidicoccus fallax TaxID=394095 RepID=A0A848LXA2_9BACT|nr:tetratricopeptide repeat protein [Pyxidicoccus fallax]NMO22406.1 tetratricopeptide repeat protein [Pyxidicoccus fallax]NPC83935.1 tetratricopeptide repeat protein [Pyxidicoccus fallax]